MPCPIRPLSSLPLCAVALAMVAGCADVPAREATPALLTVDELRAGLAATREAAPPDATLEARASALRARAARLRGTTISEEEELRRRALRLAALTP